MEPKFDILGRESFVETLFNVMLRCSEKKDTLSYAIDGEWGIGKSFVLDLLTERLSVYQNEQTNNNRFLVIRYNSWEYDYYQEPMQAIVAAIEDSLVEQNIDCFVGKTMDDVLKVAVEGFKDIANQLIRNKIGVDFSSTLDSVTSLEKLDDAMSAVKKAIKAIRKNLTNICGTYTVVILIDELDRCLPEYAIKVLNRCSHLFCDIDNLQLVYSINAKQLEHSIKMIFGENVETASYLKKFYDGTFKLDNGEIGNEILSKYMDYFSCFEIQNEKGLTEDVVPLIGALDLDIRTIEKVMERVQLSHRMLQTEVQNPSLMLFEIVSTFLSKAVYSGNMPNLVFEKEGNKAFLFPTITVGQCIEQLFRKWSTHGIHTSVYPETDLSYHSLYVCENTYGQLLYSLNQGFNSSNADAMLEDDNLSEIGNLCKEFWSIYMLMGN